MHAHVRLFRCVSPWRSFVFHYSLAALIMVAIALACALSLAFNKLKIPIKGFQEGFKPKTVLEQGVSTCNFFICRCNV